MKIGVPFEKLHVIPLNQKTSIAGVDVTFLDANHCPGSVIILFEPPNCNVGFTRYKHNLLFSVLVKISYCLLNPSLNHSSYFPIAC